MENEGVPLKTIADELLEFVKKSGKVSVEDIAKKLKSPLSTVQSLVDFLVEEKIFGIEYKFTTPFVYLYREGAENSIKEKSGTSELLTKDIFYQRAKEKKLPYDQIEGLWRKYLQQNMGTIKEAFLKKSAERKISKEKTEEMWQKYLSYL
ncbi:MAG TPA: hypothetical protein VJI97_00175 [Candidatus Nanoarchaeia archaeon]|nr:hypothetical protein [Candidatus Nanoarchaeia archaeon]